jgi:hypothetical protein
MSKENILANLNGAVISDLIFSDEEPPRILTIITTAGYHVDTASGTITHPKREQELAEFLEKLTNLKADSSFTFDASEISIEEMRDYAYDHAKKINANGGNVTQIYNRQFKVTMGEDLMELRDGLH